MLIRKLTANHVYIICGYTGKKDRKYTDLPCDWKRLKQLYPQLWIRPERLEKGVSK